ncbi:MAG: ATP-dependent DNA helicase RecG, partial [Clostridiales bacterium]
AYEELFLLQSAILKNGKIIKKAGISHGHPGREWQDFLAALPFALTQAQVRVIGEILADMEAPQVMARLLQGDVGSGKTVVAAAALYCNYLNGYQGALMAPTEILARQHYQSLQSLLEPLSVRIALLTGKVSGKKRGELLASLEAGEIDIIIGTHALIQEQVSIPCLGLAITDEQHRFGVMQRAALSGREGLADVLVMTATPIPRTLSLTLYGDLDISIIDELPPGRQPIKTYAVSYDLEVRIFAFLEKEIKKGRQIFIVCPLVEESEKLDLENAVSLYENLQKQIFPHRRLGLLHGKMKSKEKESIMDDFAQGNLDILVSTTVIEVGINIPNATVMLIREAQRFGLAQLHQLRGRIGRGGEQSYCILMNNAKGNIARERMRVLCQSNDGFLIAEEDLRLRGPGDFFGTRQHGLPELKTANLFTDAALLEMARNDVLELMEDQDFWQSEEMRLIHQYLKEKYQLLN